MKFFKEKSKRKLANKLKIEIKRCLVNTKFKLEEFRERKNDVYYKVTYIDRHGMKSHHEIEVNYSEIKDHIDDMWDHFQSAIRSITKGRNLVSR